MSLEFQPALPYAFDRLAHIMTAAFEEYFIPFQMTAERLAKLVLTDGVDLTSSRLALCDGRPVAVGLIARRGWSSRLAGMGVVKAARGQGVGKGLMLQLLDEARQRGERDMVLEVIEQNTPAVGLYKGVGFEVMGRLVGYSLSQLEGKANDRLEQVDVRKAVRALIDHGPHDLPWQNAPEAFANMGQAYEAYRLGQAYGIVIAPRQADTVVVQSLVVPATAQRQGQATHLLQALMAHFEDRTWRVPITFPDGLAPGLFEKLGFTQETLSQFRMKAVFD